MLDSAVTDFPTLPGKAKLIAALSQFWISILHIAIFGKPLHKRGCGMCELWLRMTW